MARSTKRSCGWRMASRSTVPAWPASSATYTEATQGSSNSTICRRSERRSADGDVACVITEPVLTNCCMVLPEPGFHDGLRELTRRHRQPAADRRDAHHLVRPRRLHAGARPGARPVRARQADRRRRAGQHLGHERRGRRALRRLQSDAKEPGYSGMGTTLSANPLQFAAMRATLEEVMTDAELRSYGTARRAAGDGLAADHRAATACPGMSRASARASSSSARPAR